MKDLYKVAMVFLLGNIAVAQQGFQEQLNEIKEKTEVLLNNYI